MPELVKIFLSYAHADGDGVGRIYQHLKERGYKPWLDREDILGGEEWEPAIRTGIRESDLFLLCLSPHSLVRRGVLQKEIKIALDVAEEKLDTDIFLIPVWIQVGTPLPKEEMPERLSRLQWINLPEADGWQKLIRSIDYQSRRLGRDLDSSPLATTATLTGDRGASPVDVDQLLGRLRTSLQASDPAGVEATVVSILDALHRRGHGFTAQHGTRAVAQLCRKHLVGHVHQLSDAFMRGGIDVPPIRRFYAEALLERQWLTATFDALGKLETGRVIGFDRTGTCGRSARSQPYGGVSRRRARRAGCGVRSVVESGERLPRHLQLGPPTPSVAWKQSGGPRSARSSQRTVGRNRHFTERYRGSRARGSSRQRGRGTPARYRRLRSGSLCVARARPAGRGARAAAMLSGPRADRYRKSANTERQLSGVWQLRPDIVPGTVLLRPIVEGLKVHCEPWKPVDKTSVLAPETASESGLEPRFERVFGGPHFYSVKWYEQGLSCAQHVARIETSRDGHRHRLLALRS